MAKNKSGSGVNDLLAARRRDEPFLSTGSSFCARYSAVHDCNCKAMPLVSSDISSSTPATSALKSDPWS
jgi:hypothetical protein